MFIRKIPCYSRVKRFKARLMFASLPTSTTLPARSIQSVLLVLLLVLYVLPELTCQCAAASQAASSSSRTSPASEQPADHSCCHAQAEEPVLACHSHKSGCHQASNQTSDQTTSVSEASQKAHNAATSSCCGMVKVNAPVPAVKAAGVDKEAQSKKLPLIVSWSLNPAADPTRGGGTGNRAPPCSLLPSKLPIYLLKRSLLL